jgi:hypothetical protein
VSRRIAKYFGVVLIACMLATSAGTASGSTPSRQPKYGPPGSQFSIAFPSSPRSASNTQGLLRNYPTGTKAYGFWVSPDAGNIFAAYASIPHPSTYVAVARILPSPDDGATYLQRAGLISGVRAVSAGGLSGYEFVGSENSAFNQGTKLSNPKATEGIMILGRGATLYVIIAITSDAKSARSFLRSFRAR